MNELNDKTDYQILSKNIKRIFLWSAIAIFQLFSWGSLKAQQENDLTLWYQQPAYNWNEALPIGNGRLAAMVFGGADHDRIQLNEETIWAGEPGNNVPDHVYDTIKKIRKLLFEGENLLAQKLSNTSFPREAPPNSNYGMPYQTAGNLNIAFNDQNDISDYQRNLDIGKAIASVSYQSKGIHYKREYFASIPDQVIVIRLTADQPESITCDLSLNTPFKDYDLDTRDGKLVLSGKTGSKNNKEGKVRYEVQVFPKVEGGKVTADDDKLKIDEADAVTIYVSIATNVFNYKDISGNETKKASGFLSKAVKKEFETAKQQHTDRYKEYFDRVSLHLGTVDSLKRIPTAVRVENYSNQHDPGLAALYFQFGRYLLISGSFPGSQATNLQGKWNESLYPPWDSKYTVNINTEMNYWPAEITALPEMHQPLFDMLKDLSETGKESASKMYRARGWNLHHNTDLWRISGVVDGGFFGMWPMGGAWLSQHIWEHYLYTGDKQFLKEYYPVLKGAAMFFVDALQQEPDHNWLVVSPSMSPENSYAYEEGTPIDIAYGTTMDNQLVYDLFSATMQAAHILGVDNRFADTLSIKKAALPPMHIGQYGQLQEWLKDLDRPDDHHRHVSHLYGLFPSNQISPYRTPQLFEAAKKTLLMRGDVSTGWSMAWKINLWAQLLDGNHAMKLLKDQIKPPGEGESGGSYPNLFDAHPPFQIDGNFGVTSGIARMLLQSNDGSLFILPALPDAWLSGEVKGLRARGGFIVDIQWEKGKVTRLVVHSTQGGNCRIRTYNPMKLTDKSHLSPAKGENSNPFYATPEIKQAIVSPKAQLEESLLKPTHIYDFTTKKNTTYTLIQSDEQ